MTRLRSERSGWEGRQWKEKTCGAGGSAHLVVAQSVVLDELVRELERR